MSFQRELTFYLIPKWRRNLRFSPNLRNEKETQFVQLEESITHRVRIKISKLFLFWKISTYYPPEQPHRFNYEWRHRSGCKRDIVCQSDPCFPQSNCWTPTVISILRSRGEKGVGGSKDVKSKGIVKGCNYLEGDHVRLIQCIQCVENFMPQNSSGGW